MTTLGRIATRRRALLLGVVLALVVTAVVYLVRDSDDDGRAGAPGRGLGALCSGSGESADEVSVEGNRFVAGGRPWYPRGLNVVRFVGEAEIAAGEGARVADSLDRWDERECELMKEFGANALRFQLGQPTLDPESDLYSPDYLATVNQRVQEALDSGFVVSLSLQWQKPESAPRQPRPDRNSVLIWQELAETWGDDGRVIFELYNEPKGPPTDENWQIWLRGGPFEENPSGQSVGIQDLIDTVRDAGAENTLLLPGLKLQKSFEGLPADEVVDPLDNYGYAFHTPNLTRGERVLDRRIGYLAAEYPLWATEQVGASPWGKCYEELDEDYEWYFPWLADNGIGVTSPWDRSAVWGTQFGDELTTMDDFSCRPATEGVSGPGELFRDLFLSGYPS